MSILYTDINPSIINVNKSTLLPITNGTLHIDTTDPITIFMIPPENPTDILTMIKISNDDNPVMLFCDDDDNQNITIDNNHIVIFGLNKDILLSKGKINTLVIKANNNNWIISN